MGWEETEVGVEVEAGLGFRGQIPRSGLGGSKTQEMERGGRQRREAQKRLTSPEGRPFSGEGCKAEACLKRPLGKGPSGSEGSRREGIRGPRCAQEPGSGSSHLRRCKDPE